MAGSSWAVEDEEWEESVDAVRDRYGLYVGVLVL